MGGERKNVGPSNTLFINSLSGIVNVNDARCDIVT